MTCKIQSQSTYLCDTKLAPLIPQAVEGLLDATSGADADLLPHYRECHLLVLKALQDGRAYGPQWCNKQITR